MHSWYSIVLKFPQIKAEFHFTEFNLLTEFASEKKFDFELPFGADENFS